MALPLGSSAPRTAALPGLMGLPVDAGHYAPHDALARAPSAAEVAAYGAAAPPADFGSLHGDYRLHRELPKEYDFGQGEGRPSPGGAPVIATADELACLAMKCLTVDAVNTSNPMGAVGHRGLGQRGLGMGLNDDAPWLPYRCDPISQRVECVDSPVDPREPSVGGKPREVSFSTQMVRRAVSFIFEERENSPISGRRNTAIAA